MKNWIILFLILFIPSVVSAEFIGVMGSVNPETLIDLKDDFIGGSIESGEIGKLGWSFTGTNAVVAHTTASTNNPGIKNIATEAVINSPAILMLSNGVTDTSFIPSLLFDVTFIVNLPSVVDTKVRIGVSDDWTNYTNSTRGAWFVFNTGGTDEISSTTKWATVTRTAGATTFNNTTIADVSAGTTIYKLRIVRTSSTAIDFYIAGVLMFTHSTNLPSAAVLPGIFVESLAASTSKGINIDYFRLKLPVSR